jgi:4-hydroxybenzoate polyprenyltransferase
MEYYFSLLRVFEVVIMTWAFTVSCLTTPRFSFSIFFIPVIASIILFYSGNNILITMYKKRLWEKSYHTTAQFQGDSTLVLIILSLSLVFSLAGGFDYFLLLFIMLLIIYLHARNTKNLGFLRNLVSSFISSSVFGLAMLFTGQLSLNLFFFAIFLFFFMAREILRDSEEIERDLSAGLRTFPLHYGQTWTLMAANIFMVAGISLSLVLCSMGSFGPLYLALSFITFIIFALLFRFEGSMQTSRIRQAIDAIMLFFLSGTLFAFIH